MYLLMLVMGVKIVLPVEAMLVLFIDFILLLSLLIWLFRYILR